MTEAPLAEGMNGRDRELVAFIQCQPQPQHGRVALRVGDVCPRPRILGQWFDGIRIYAAASGPTRSRRTWAGLR